MAGTITPTSFSIGNCRLEIESNDRTTVLQSDPKCLLISLNSPATIKISVDKICNICESDEDYGFLLINPKDADSRNKLLLEDVLKLYKTELPTMNYAANTGKKSQFLERCILSGKYKTLILASRSVKGFGEVIAAVSFQIIPKDTQYAEVPLAAVRSEYQGKGIGKVLCRELQGRLQNVGTSTIYCWADRTSEAFWSKQGFSSVGEVDKRGKNRKLPIKPDIRRALSFPGGSLLMVSYLKDDLTRLGNCNKDDKTCFSELQIKPPYSSSMPPQIASPILDGSNDLSLREAATQINRNCRLLRFTEGNPPITLEPQCLRGSDALDSLNLNGNGVDSMQEDSGNGTDWKGCSSGPPLKRLAWHSSLSSLKSKRVRVEHVTDYCQDSDKDLDGDNCFVQSSDCKETVQMLSSCSTQPSSVRVPVQCDKLRNIAYDLASKGHCPRIMFMNIADDAKKTWLAEVVQNLGGSVTNNGIFSTHVITGKARRTSNFCTALCSGAWIVSPSWLKESFREGRFIGESQFILEDEDYTFKYKCELRDAVMRAKANPNSLLKEYDVCLSKHVQPSFHVLSAIIMAAGGTVSRGLQTLKEPSKTIFVACEEDMADALLAAKNGARTFSSDWLMNCIMKQELDLDAPQFTESL